MTTLTTVESTVAVHSTDVRARFRDLLAAEWIKFWSLRSMRWGLAFLAVAVIVINVDAALFDYHMWPSFSANTRAHFYPLRDAFGNNAYLFLMIATASLGAMTIVGEYSSGLIRTTFAAVPARRSVVAAKVAVVAAVFTAAGTLIAGVSFGASQAILSGRDAGISIGAAGVPRAFIASALLAPVCAITGMGIGALIRHAATAVVTAIVVLLLLPQFFDQTRPWKAAVAHALPRNAWQRLADISAQVQVDGWYPASIGESWIVYAAWPFVATVVALIVVHGRDV